MGAWGVMTFEDDTALDTLDDWIEERATAIDLEEEVRGILSQDEFDYDAGQVAGVLAAVVEFALSPGTAPDFEESKDLNESLSVWIEGLDKSKMLELVPLAILGLERMYSDESELNELWAESDEFYDQWVSFNKERLNRLKLICQAG